MKKIIPIGLIFGADFSLGRAYRSFNNAQGEHRGEVKNYEYKSEIDAAEVLSKMKRFIESFGFASIGDLEDCICQ